jgi:hypothetical protein
LGSGRIIEDSMGKMEDENKGWKKSVGKKDEVKL